MTAFAPPTADPHGLRAAARRLAGAGADVDARGSAVAGAGNAALVGWQGSASLLMAARAAQLRRSAEHAAHELVVLATATDRYADAAERARHEVAVLNERWEEAERRAAQQAAAARQAAAEAQRRAQAAAARARAAGDTVQRVASRTYDDGSAELAQTQAELRRRYDAVVEELEDDGFSLERALRQRDPTAFLPDWVAGGVYTVQSGIRAISLTTKGIGWTRYTVAVAQVSRYFDLGHDTIRGAIAASDEARTLKELLYGRTSRLPVAGRPLTAAGKAFLPVTLFTGIGDVLSGGGYDGWRDPVTRVLGGAGAAGAGALLFAGAALGPVGLAVAAGAVLAYGAWSLGNALYDHRQQIGAFLGRARDGVVTAAGAVTTAAGRTLDRARGAAGRVLDTLTSPVRLLPSLGGLF